MEALNSLEHLIIRSKPSEADAIKQHVTNHLEQTIGPSNGRKKLKDKVSAGYSVKRLLTTIEQRLKRKPDINLYETHALCLSYLKYLCGMKDSKETKYEYLERQCGLMHCHLHWLRYEDVERVGRDVFNDIHKRVLKRKNMPTGQVLPTYESRTPTHCRLDSQTVKVVITVGIALLRVHWSSIKDNEENEDGCRHFLSLVKEMEQWTEHSQSLERTTLLKFLMDCTRSLVKKRSHVMINWITKLCTMTLNQFWIKNIHEICDFGKEICSSVFSRRDDTFFHNPAIVVKVLECIAKRCIDVHQQANIVNKFLELAGYCTVNYGAETKNQCTDLVLSLRRLTDMFTHQVNLPVVPVVLKHLVITLLLKDLEFYILQGGNASQPMSISEVSNDLEACLEEWSRLKNRKDVQLDHMFFYDILSSFILSNRTIDALEDNTDPMKLPKIPDVFESFINEFSSNRKYERKDIKVAAKVGVAHFIFLLTTKQDTKSSEVALMKLKKNKPEVLNDLIQILDEVSQALKENARRNEAIETTGLCCMIQWERLSSFCKMLSSTKHGVEPGFSEYTVVGFVEKAYEDSAVLLELLNKHRRDKINEMSKDFLEKWFKVEKCFCIPCPVALVRQLVKIQDKPTQENQALDNVSTICSLVPSLITSSKSCIILSEELNQYQENRFSNPELCRYMDKHIRSLISKIKSESYDLEFSISLIDCGSRLASCGSICQSDSIKYNDQAISILHGLENSDKTGQVHYLLFKAYCSNALCKRIVNPFSKEFIEDIKGAIKAYESECLAKIKFCDEEQNLFYYVADLLALEGHMVQLAGLYKMMLKRSALSGINIHTTLDMAWNTGSLNHAMCASPVDALFMETLLEHNSNSDGVQFWTDGRMGESQKVGVELCLSVCPTISSVHSHADAHAKKAQKTIDEIKSAASKQGPKDSDNFKAARMYYHLAERLIAKGLMNEALTYADKGYSLRDKLLSQSFNIEWHRGEQEIDVQGETFRIRKFVCKRFDMIPACVSPSENQLHSTPTPWSTVRFYLESALQTGTLEEMIGNANQAETKFLLGKSIASLLNLPTFVAAFSTRLGKIYCKNGFLKLASEELKSANSLLEDDRSSYGCEKCKIIRKVTLEMELGDHCLSVFKTSEKVLEHYLQLAIKWYSKAIENLERNIWWDNDARPGQKTSKTPTFCKAFGILGACGSEAKCWHCLPSLCESSSLKASIQTKWECIRRCHRMRLETRLGKCHKLHGDAKKEYMHLKSSICVLVSRNAFNLKEVSTSFVDELLINGVMGDAYGVEHASILYKICCFSLINKDTGNVDKLSITSILRGLKIAFILSREVRKLHKKVSRVLAVLYAYLSEDKEFSPGETISVSHWASYFHQSSIGNYFNSFLLSQDQNPVEVDALRKVLAPHSLDVLETSVSEFYETLPEFTVLCMSMLSEKSDKFLKHLLPESPTSAWIMISRISFKRGPLLIILPVLKRFEDFQFETHAPLVSDWKCPWAHGVFDEIVPVLRRVLEEDSKLNTSRLNNILRRDYKIKLDKHFLDLLSDLENSLFGPWKYLLLGEWSDNNDLDEIVQEMKSLPSGPHVDERILKAVMEGVPSNFQDEQVLADLILNNGCYVKRSNPNDELRKQLVTNISRNVQTILKKRGDKICRNPVIFVLDNEIQMFPLENMPLLQKEPIYRMPSVGSVMWSSSRRKDPKKGKTIIDPHSCFYMFFTDCQETISCFDRWSKNAPNFKGHCIPNRMSTEKLEKLETHGVTLETLKRALESRDLFLYSGHGDARQYIESDVIRKVKASCAVCLFGCSSGYIRNRRSRVPQGAPLDYLLAGCPVIISNLWVVTAKSCEVLATELLDSWLKAAPAIIVDCSKNQQTKFGATRLCIHQTDLASLFLRAREIKSDRIFKVDLAGTVIYGLPTRIARRTSEDLSKDHMHE